ncbi:NmrA family transcriptional regulator [Nostoc sp. 3335mG]|nr:NmrA family transcriptional regulator [Nostoc sp. 3335mG]
MDQRPIAIVGGLGKTGRRVAKLLTAAGHGVRPLSRSTEPAFDWDDPAGWAAALAGCASAYVSFQPDLSVPDAADRIGRIAQLAAEAGLERMILLSGRGEPGALAAEAALGQAGLAWAVIRSSWFAQNFSESFLADAVAAGRVVVPLGTAAEPFVDADDIAEVAVRLLTGGAPMGRVYEVTGPEALRFAQACAILAEASGRPVRCEEVPVAAFEADLRAGGVSDDLIPVLVDLFTTTLDGRNRAVASGVSDALGRAPRSFRDYAAALHPTPVSGA